MVHNASTPLIRPANADEIRLLAYINLAARERKVGPRIPKPTINELYTRYESFYDNYGPEFITTAVTSSDKPVGFAVVSPKGTLHDIYHIGPRGTGSILIQSVEEICKRNWTLVITGMAMKGSENFYKKHGFKLQGFDFSKALQI
jgi:histone acetyltransferase (RNA polymerase elongator complex component)